jgi:uncharacterized membrane protein YcaP (DUF421 family)
METVIRITIIYLLILMGLRVLGKREFSQLSTIEVVALLMIPELVAQALVREDFSLTNAIIALSTLFTLVFLNSLLSLHSEKVSKLISGEPTILVIRGKIQEDILSKERITVEEIYNQMHKSGLENLKDVKWAILESDGKISIVPTESKYPNFSRYKENQIK